MTAARLSDDDARERVEALVAAARALVCDERGVFAPDGDLVARMADASGLSVPNVHHALEHALEWQAARSDCASLVAGAGARQEGPLALVLAANVTTAALRALACAVARSHEVVVYPSSRDAVLARELVRAAGIPGLSLVDRREAVPWSDPRAHTVLYGSARTAAELRARVAGTLEVHGPGLGVAILTDEADDDAIAALADDVAAFDQRGCLSPRIALHIGSEARGAAIAERLHAALDRLGAARPIGSLDEEDRIARGAFRRAGMLLGRVWSGPHGVVVHETSAPPAPAPAARTITVHTVRDRAEASAWIAPVTPLLSSLGARDAALRESFLAGASLRRSDLGRMQRPPFDGPVDLRPHGPPHGPKGAVSG
jgi:hypothetical protein